jgi:hypothetical protein
LSGLRRQIHSQSRIELREEVDDGLGAMPEQHIRGNTLVKRQEVALQWQVLMTSLSSMIRATALDDLRA